MQHSKHTRVSRGFGDKDGFSEIGPIDVPRVPILGIHDYKEIRLDSPLEAWFQGGIDSDDEKPLP